MDYEKKYNEALERARALWQEAIEKEYVEDYLKDYETIFPELRESEDERIRRTLVEYFGPKVQLDFVRGVPIQKIRDWLEKQKEPEYGPYKKERETWVENIITDTFPKQDGDFISEEDYRNILRRTANHFYVMGEKQKEQKPNIELIQRSWYMEGYNDREFGKEPKWILKTGEGGPKHELNPKYGQPLADEQKPVLTAKEAWKEMRLEVYAQASGNRHEPNYSDDSTKMFSLCDIDEIFEKIGNSTVEQKSAWSEDIIRKAIKEVGLTQHQIDWFKTNLQNE